MKHFLTLLLSLIISFSWAQKKELKQAKKLYKANQIFEAQSFLETNKAILEGAELKYSSQYNFLRFQIAFTQKEYRIAYDYLKLAKKNTKLSIVIAEQQRSLLQNIVETAIEQSGKSEYLLSAKNLHLAYTIDPIANIDYLYFAATAAVNSKDWDLSLQYYLTLKNIKYDGIKTLYYATLVSDNTENEISKSEYDLFQKSKEYSNFRTEDTDSKFPEIVKNVALIYNQLGQKELAIAAVKDARAENTNDLGLILTEANIYIELGEKDKFKDLMGEAIAQDPQNATLYYNLAVVTSDLGDKVNARSYYEKAIELDPKMSNGYLNLVALILEEEPEIVEKMNSLGNSRADTAKYDLLKEQRENIYLECVPILKTLIGLSGKNIEAVNTLKNIYGTLGNNDGFMEMKKLLETIDGVE